MSTDMLLLTLCVVANIVILADHYYLHKQIREFEEFHGVTMKHIEDFHQVIKETFTRIAQAQEKKDKKHEKVSKDKKG